MHDELNMERSSPTTKLIPDQKLVRQQICLDFLGRLDEVPELMENFIACDKTCIVQYDVENKRQSMQRKTPASTRMKKINEIKI